MLQSEIQLLTMFSSFPIPTVTVAHTSYLLMRKLLGLVRSRCPQTVHNFQ